MVLSVDNRSWCYYWRHFPAWFSFSAKSFHQKKPQNFEKNEKIVVLLNDWLIHLCLQEPDFALFFFFFFLIGKWNHSNQNKNMHSNFVWPWWRKRGYRARKKRNSKVGWGGLGGWARVVVSRPNSLPFPFRTPGLLEKAKKWNSNFLLECSAQKNRTTFSDVPLLSEIFR